MQINPRHSINQPGIRNESKLTQLEKLVQANSHIALANNIRLDVLLADTQENRKKADVDRAAWKASFMEQRNEMRLAGEHSDQRFETMLAQLNRTVGRVKALEKAS